MTMQVRKDGNTYGKKAVAVAAIVILLVAVSATWAKYAAQVSGADDASIAAFKVSSGFENDASISLFDNVYDLDVQDVDYDNPVLETDVAQGRIAPGTWGKFDISLQNDSEVAVDYELGLSLEGGSVPLEFSLDAGTWKAASGFGALAGATGELAVPSKLEPAPAADVADMSKKTQTVYWRWLYQTGTTEEEIDKADQNDTSLGIGTEGAVAPKAKVSVTFTQKG